MADTNLEALRRLSDNLAALFRSPDVFAFLVDMHIVMPDAPDLPVHLPMLSARSPFLHDFFMRRAAAVEGNRLDLRELLGEKMEVGYESLQLVLEYLYTGRVGDLPKSVCVCADVDGCTHVGCHPVISFMVQVLFAASTLQVAKLTNLFQVHLFPPFSVAMISSYQTFIILGGNGMFISQMFQCYISAEWDRSISYYFS